MYGVYGRVYVVWLCDGCSESFFASPATCADDVRTLFLSFWDYLRPGQTLAFVALEEMSY